MKSAVVFCFILLVVTFAGCATLNKVFPSKVDEQGNVIPASHEASDMANTVAGFIPNGYGTIFLTAFAGVWNFYERYKRNRSEKTLMATVRAIKEAGQDPATKDDIDKIKELLSKAHAMAGVKKEINAMIAKT